jgi:hypothetical protein
LERDREAIIKAIADIDPKGPPPAPEADSWLPLSLEKLPPVELFPTDVLPFSTTRLVTEGADSIGCPPDFLGLPILAVAGGTIGRSVNLMLKTNYFAGATLFVGDVGPPSDGKTPALMAVAAPVRAIDDELSLEHTKAVEQWKLANTGTPKGSWSPAPKPRRIDIDDATMEVLPLILGDNPRGLIMIRDELTAFVLGMNQFKGGKGNDRSNALKIWSGDRIIKDRVNHENHVPIRCAHPSLTILGGLTPDMLGSLIDPRGRADGFIDRFLLAYPDPLPVADWTERGIPADVADDWRSLVARLWMRPLDVKNGQPVPHVAYLTVKGKARWEERYNEHSAEMNAVDFPPFLRGPWGKLREYAGRLTLILTLMHHAADPLADPLAVPQVGGNRVDAAWKLIDYFKSHARRIHAAIACGPGTGETRAAKAIIEWVQAGRMPTFNEHDLKQARRWIGQEDLDAALAALTKQNAIRPRQAPPANPKGGRPPSPAYDVNPSLLVAQNP